MKIDPTEAFVPIEPPADGLAALRTRLAREGRPRRRPWLRLAPVGLAVAGVALLVRWWPGPDPAPGQLAARAAAENFPVMAALGLVELPAEPVTLLPGPRPGTVALERLPVASPSVVLYRLRR
jgi:hypothetical protein